MKKNPHTKCSDKFIILFLISSFLNYQNQTWTKKPFKLSKPISVKIFSKKVMMGKPLSSFARKHAAKLISKIGLFPFSSTLCQNFSKLNLKKRLNQYQFPNNLMKQISGQIIKPKQKKRETKKKKIRLFSVKQIGKYF